MRVANYYKGMIIKVEEMPVPAIGPGELLVKVMASGICGSDVLQWYRDKKAAAGPVVLGHEISGEIAAVGQGVENYRVGERVFVAHHIPCNTCHYCLRGYHTACETLHTTNFDPGGFAEFLRVPKLNTDRGVFVLPDELSHDEGTFVEPLGCVIRGQRLAHVRPGQSVLILGAGISGLLHILMAKACGAGQIMATDVNDYRLAKAASLGAVVTHAATDVPNWVKEVNSNRLADLVIVCTGALPAFEQALKSVDRGGTVLCFATTEPSVTIPVPMNEFWRNEIKLLPSYGSAPLDAFEAIELMRRGRVPVKELITHRLSLDQAPLGFRLVKEARDSIKVIIEPQAHGGQQ